MTKEETQRRICALITRVGVAKFGRAVVHDYDRKVLEFITQAVETALRKESNR